MPIVKGSKVKVHYTGTLDDGTVFDSSEGRDPLAFEIGAGQIIPGFENALMGMNAGEEKSIKLEPKDAYGEHNPQLIKKLPKDKLPPQVKAGMMLLIGLPNGAKMPVKVVEVADDGVSIDLNHPLAGKTLNFKIKVVEFN